MDILTTRDLADQFDIAEAEIRSLARNGVLTAERHGNLWLFDPAAIDELADLLGDEEQDPDENEPGDYDDDDDDDDE